MWLQDPACNCVVRVVHLGGEGTRLRREVKNVSVTSHQGRRTSILDLRLTGPLFKSRLFGVEFCIRSSEMGSLEFARPPYYNGIWYPLTRPRPDLK
jgi:hypothetical protein